MAEQQTGTATVAENKQQNVESKPQSLIEKIMARIQEIKNARASGRNDRILEADVRREANQILQDELRRQSQKSKDLSKTLSLYKEQIPPDNATSEQVSQIEKTVEAYVEAGKLGLVNAPVDEATKAIYDSVINKLYDQGISPRIAIRFEPLIHGLANKGQYVKFSAEGQAPTEFEQDLQNLLSNQDTEFMVHDIIAPLVAQKKLGNITTDQFKAKIEQLKNTKEKKQNNQNSAQEDPQEVLNNANVERKYETYKARLKEITKGEKQSVDSKKRSIQKRRESIENSQNLTDNEREAQLNALRQEEINLNNAGHELYSRPDAVLSYLESSEEAPEINPPFTSEEEIRNYLLAQGFSENEINEMRKIYPVMSEMQGRVLGQGTGYGELGKTIQTKYSRDRLYNKIIKDGLIDIKEVEDRQAELEDDIGVLFDTLYNSPKSDFQEAFSPYSEGQMLRNVIQHLRKVFGEISDQYAKQKSGNGGQNNVQYREFKAYADDIFRDKIISVIQRRPAIESVVHQYQQMGATIDLQNLQNIYKKYDVTTLQEFYNDELTRVMADIMPQFVQKKLIENDNNVVTDLFQLVQDERTIKEGVVKQNGEDESEPYTYERQVIKYKDECIEYMEKILKEMKEAGKLNTNVSKDRINARFSRAYLDSFLLTLRGVKVLARANPMHAQFEDIPFWQIVTRVFNPKHDWGKMGLRGRGGPRAGDAETYEFQAQENFMFNEMEFQKWRERFGDIYDDFHPAEIMKKGRSKILYRVFPDNDELMKDLHTGKWDVFQSMVEVYHGLGQGNIIDQGGWPFARFRNETIQEETAKFKDAEGKPLDWDKLDFYSKEGEMGQFEVVCRTAGVIPAFWFAGDQAGDETKRQFKRFIARDKIKAAREAGSTENQDDIATRHWLTLGEEEYEKVLDKYTVGPDKFKKLYNVKLGGKSVSVSHREYGLHRELALKGKTFHQLLLKDPVAWLGEMTQMLPELSQGFVTYTDRRDGKKYNVKASDFYFDRNKYPDDVIAQTDKEIRDRFRFQALTKFRGREEDNFMSNVPHLKKIMDFYTNLINSYVEEDVDVNRKISDEDLKKLKDVKSKSYSAMFSTLSKAHQIAVESREAAIDPQDTINKDENGVEDKRIHELMFGQEGLITHFDDMVSPPNYFGDGDTDLGEQDGFYQRWAYTTKQTNRLTLPEGDTNMDILTKGAKSKQMLERRLATNMTFAKAQEVLGQVPSVCKEAGDANSFDEWYGKIEKLHSDMAALADEDQGLEQKYQMELYIAICNYFSLDSSVEKMFIGLIEDMRLGKDKAIVSIKADYANKFMLDADARRLYMRKLRDKTYIKGGYDALFGAGIDTIESVAGVSAWEIIKKQLIYTAVIGTAFVVAYAIKEGYEEEVDDD